MTNEEILKQYQPIGLSMHLKSYGNSPYERGEIGGHTKLYTEQQVLEMMDEVADRYIKAIEEVVG